MEEIRVARPPELILDGDQRFVVRGRLEVLDRVGHMLHVARQPMQRPRGLVVMQANVPLIRQLLDGILRVGALRKRGSDGK